ncbi:MAG: DUF5666 domain-containing protein [Candidatus Moranbacteria bacterium]|nr:DUF5666 domain-containing protein [Candidatus Moranbacteria bacterium]
MQKKNMINLAVLVIIAGGMFYGGMQYGLNKATGAAAQAKQGRNGGGSGVADNGGGPGGGGQRGQRGPNGGSGFSNGQILSKDDTSITIKTRDGSSKIVYFSGSTTIGKTAPGAASDLSTGQNVMVSGNSNPDGSIAADNIQIRPAQPAGQNPGQN